MKSGTSRRITVTVLFSALALPVRLVAQDDTRKPTFIIIDVPGAGTGPGQGTLDPKINTPVSCKTPSALSSFPASPYNPTDESQNTFRFDERRMAQTIVASLLQATDKVASRPPAWASLARSSSFC